MTTTESVLALSGPITAAAWFVASLVIKDRSRETAKIEFTGLIKGALAEFKGALVQELNGTYRRTAECVLTMGPMKEKLSSVEAKLNELHDYSHSSKHELDNRMFGIQAKLNAQEADQS